MPTTAQQVFDITMALIDEVMDDGTISIPNTVTYNAKTPKLLTLLQAELIKQGDMFSTYEISNSPIANLLGNRTEYDIREFEGAEFTIECKGSAKAYYFEADRVGVVYVEDYTTAWNTLKTINTTLTPDGFTAYKGVVTPTSGATRSRLRFAGSYYYRTVNRALFSIPFAADTDVPVYRPWVKKAMPIDFKSVDEIIKEESSSYTRDAKYKWEGRRNLYIDYYYKGNIRIQYRPVPIPITALTNDMQVDDVTAVKVIPYGLAAHLLIGENDSKASYFNGRYEELKAEASKKGPASFEKITDVYGGSSYGLY
jgi:hypothetical protein